MWPLWTKMGWSTLNNKFSDVSIELTNWLKVVLNK